MRKILLATDSTSTFTFEEAKKYGIELLPLSIIINQKEYKDHIDISTEELCDKLKDGAVPTTSQPNVGLVEETMTKWKEENWDAIIIVTLSSVLSGTFSGFNMIKEQLEMDNVYIIDSRTLASPVREAMICSSEMVKEGKDEFEIIKVLENKFNNTFSMLYVKTLDQLKKGGRISPMVARALDFIKMKPLIYLNPETITLEKYGLARTDGKIIDMIVNEFKKQNISADTHEFYIPHIEADEATLSKVEKTLKENFNDIKVNYVTLPAVLICHGGLGCFAVQSILK